MSNIKIGKIGAGFTGISVVIFAMAMLIELIIGTNTEYISYLSCMFIAIGYILLAAGVVSLNEDKQKNATGLVGIAFGVVYAVMIFISYFAMLTTVRLNTGLSEEMLSIISYSHLGSLFFNYNLLGYGLMSLSTFFVGFTIELKNKGDKIFRALLWVHGIFFISCMIMPMTGAFSTETNPHIGTAILMFWCVFFLPICILGWKYFGKQI